MNKPSTLWNERARALMRERGILIKDVAEALDMTPGNVGHYLSGRRQPKPGQLRKLAARIGVSVSELIEDDPLFARSQIEHDMLEALRRMPEPAREMALKMALGLVPEDSPGDPAGTA